MRLLANGAFVVAETHGGDVHGATYAAREEARLSEGVVFATRGQLPEVLMYFLDRPKEREIVAKKGQSVFMANREEAYLSSQINELDLNYL